MNSDKLKARRVPPIL